MNESINSGLNLGVLVSGEGTNLQAILESIAKGDLNARVRVVISNRQRAPALQRARRFGVPVAVLSHRSFSDRPSYESELVRTFQQHGAQWIVLAGFMRILTGHFLTHFPNRVVNIHPSLLPAFPGTEAPAQAIAHGVRIAGCTVHFVDEGVDTGPIIAQTAVPVLPQDDVERLTKRIHIQEYALFPRVLQMIASGKVHRDGVHVTVSPSNQSSASNVALSSV